MTTSSYSGEEGMDSNQRRLSSAVLPFFAVNVFMVHARGFEPSNLSLIRRMLDPLKLCVHF